MARFLIALLSFLFCVTLCAETPSCLYWEGGRKFEIFIKDTVLPETYTRQFFVYKRNLSDGNVSSLLKRDSLYRINNPFVAELPMKRLHYPRVDTVEGTPYLFFFYEREPSHVSVMNTEIVAAMLSLSDGRCYELYSKGRRVNVKLRTSSLSSDYVFLCFSQSASDSANACVLDYLKTQVEKTGFVKPISDLDLKSVKNYGLNWNFLNGGGRMEKRGKIEFPFYKEPFAPLKVSVFGVRILESERYKVVAFPYGDVLAYDKRSNSYFVVWAMESLQRDDYSASLCWYGDGVSMLLMKGVFNLSEFVVDLNSGSLQYLKKEK